MRNINKISRVSLKNENKSGGSVVKPLVTASLVAMAALAAFAGPSSAEAQVVNGVAYAPTILSPVTGGIVSVTLQNNSSTNQPARVVTFGQVFKQGDLPAGSGLSAVTTGGASVPAAMTVKATNPDGSVRHAIVSLSVPAIAANSSATVKLSAAGTQPVPGGIKVTDIVRPGWAPVAVFTFHSPSSTTVSVNVSNLVTKAITDGTAAVWINNSLTKEVRVSTKLNAQMTATFDIRVSSDGQIKTDVIVANDEAFTVTSSFVYDVAITNKGKTLFQESNLSHYPYSNWHEELWTGTDQSGVNVALDPEYMARAGAIAEYDFSLGLATSTLGSFNSALAGARSGPMLASLITPWIGQTGERPDIGITTAWAANWLVSQDPSAKAVMLAQANDAGSVPWHLRDAATNAPLSIANHPTTWADYRGSSESSTPQDILASTFDTTAAFNAGGWGLDVAHEPDLSFVPYLVTGNHYYLDELEFEAAYLAVAGNPGYRQGSQALIYPVNQQRGTAWNIRDFANTAWIAPDGDPLKTTFTGVVANNLNGLNGVFTQIHATGAEGQIEGYLPDIAFGSSQNAPWQGNYLTMTMDLAARRGMTNASANEAWLNQYNSGLFTNGANGFNPLNGPGYWLSFDPLSNPEPAAGTPVQSAPVANSWAQFYAYNYSNVAGYTAPTGLANTPSCTYCYPALASMSTAEALSTTGSVKAIWAFAYLVGNTPSLIQPGGYVSDPSWHVTPVLSDGYHLRTADLQIIPDAGGSATIVGTHGLIAGGAGTNTLNGGTGWSVLYAGTGRSTINANGGTTYIVAGAGEGSTSATAVVNAALAGQEVIMDFNPSFDVLKVKNSGGGAVHATADASGDAVLTFPSGHTVTLIGMAPSAVNANWVLMQ